MRNLKCGLMMLVLLSAVPFKVLAADLKHAELIQLLATTERSERHYTETKELAFLEASVVSKGRLVFTPPDRLVKQVEEPDQGRYEIAGNTMVISRSGESEQVVSIDSHPLLRVFIDTLRAVLTGDLKALEAHYSLELTGTRVAWRLQLNPLDNQLAALVESLVINGHGARIEQMVTQEQGGDRTVLVLHDDAG